MRPDHLASSDLRSGDVPLPDAPWEAIQTFAHRFHAYKVVGSLPGAARITDEVRALHDEEQPLPDDLTQLRTALFVTARAGRHGHDEDGDAEFCRALVARVVQLVAP